MLQNPVIQVLAADSVIPQLKHWGHDDHFTEQELEEMVSSYDPQLHEAPVTLDHVQEGPSLGWVAKLEKQGKGLYAHLKDVHYDLVSLVRQKKYKKISSELSMDFQNSGKIYFTGVSFLGAGKPAVKGMADPLLSENGRVLAFLSEKTKGKMICAPEVELDEKLFAETETKKETKGEPEMKLEETKKEKEEVDLTATEVENQRLRRENIEKDKRLAEVDRRRKLESIDNDLTELCEKGKLTPAQRKPLEILMALLPDVKIRFDSKEQTPREILLAFVENLKPAMQFGMLNLGEETRGGPIRKSLIPRGVNAEDVDRGSAELAAVAQDIQTRDKCDYATALRKANEEHPDLYASTVKTR